MRLRGVSNATRQHFNREGRAKAGYVDQRAALVALGNDREHHPYLCDFCGQWHLGGVLSVPKKRKRR
jgi:hypothetical protein